MQDAAVRSPMRRPALPAKHHQLLFERLQAGEAGAHPGELGVDELVDLAALRARVLDEFQQAGDIGQRNVQGAAMADEAQSLEMSLCVAAIAVVRTRRRRKQADPLVVADGFDVHPGGLRQFAYFHCRVRDRCDTRSLPA